MLIGRLARYVTEALDYVAGYVLLSDLSEHAYQFERGSAADKGKGCDSFAPVGPYLVTPDEVADVHALPLWLRVNGRLMQESSTRHLLFRVLYLIAYISQFMTLPPGNLIANGGWFAALRGSLRLHPGHQRAHHRPASERGWRLG